MCSKRKLHGSTASAARIGLSSLAAAGVGLGRLDRLVDAQYETGGLGGSRDRVDLDDGGLPHGRLEVVGDVLVVDVDAVPEAALGVLLTQLVEYVGGVEAGVLAQLARYDLEGARQRRYDHLLLAGNGARVLAQEARRLHLDGAAARHDRVVLDRAAHDHDGVVERALGLLDELLGAAAQYERARLGLRAAGEDVVAFAADLLLLEEGALA